jgi:putative DNA primase/helicase
LQDKHLRRSLTEKGRGNTGNTLPALAPKLPQDTPPDLAPEVEVQRPAFQTHDDWFQLAGQKMRPGLYWHGYGKSPQDADPPPVDIWICSPIHAEAITAGEQGADWGMLLRFTDPRGRWKEWAAPMRLLKGSGEDLRGELLDLGVRIDPQHRNRLTEWMMGRYPERRITAATRTGWHEGQDGRCFVLPGGTIGAEDVRFQAEHAAHDDFRTAGTLDGWREGVAAPCEGNPVLLLAMSAAFAGPLLKVAKQQEVGGAGVHLLGDSSRGKTTALQAAASVWGGPGFVRTWRATANGIEATAAALNDTLLPLDEISECDPREIGSVVYSLANGTGKQRAARTGGTRAVARWRIVALSSGERTLDAHMSEAGKRAKAGQEARLLDVPATDRTHGAFDELHGYADGRAFADALKQATATHYGHAGPAFVGRILQDGRDLPALLAQCIEHPAFTAADGLELRAAGVFALCGFAGELATEYGLTGWASGSAARAAAELFQAWRDLRGGGHTESRQILDGVRAFLLAHGDSRFSALPRGTEAEGTDEAVRDRAGWWRDDDDGRAYFLTSGALRQAVPGYDIKRILDALDAAGWIIERDSDKRSKRVRIKGNPQSLYAIRPTEESDDGRP